MSLVRFIGPRGEMWQRGGLTWRSLCCQVPLGALGHPKHPWGAAATSFEGQPQATTSPPCPPWVLQCCNPAAGARPRPVNRQVNAPLIGVETSCGHSGNSELHSLSTFLMAQPISAAASKHSTRGPCIYAIKKKRKRKGMLLWQER